MISRRNFLLGTSAMAGAGALVYGNLPAKKSTAVSHGDFEITRTMEEWQAVLTPAQYSVLREEDTERPGTSKFLSEKRAGTFHCAGCELAVYKNEDKYDSGTGWPSFTKAIRGSIGTKVDYQILFKRTEVHCRRCGGHFGHIFDDGPKPTGKRHCLNGLALEFQVDV